MIIRKETEKDYKEVESLTREAFWNVYRPGCDEHYVLHKMREDQTFIKELDYVIEQDGVIVANIVYAWAYVEEPSGKRHRIAIFGPLSVLPEKQKQGYGSILVRHTLQLAKDMGIALIAITGNPQYYKRFGFDRAEDYGIFYEDNKDFPFFMLKILDEEQAKHIRGRYSDPSVYVVTADEVDAFDAQFPPKIKEKRKGQLG